MPLIQKYFMAHKNLIESWTKPNFLMHFVQMFDAIKFLLHFTTDIVTLFASEIQQVFWGGGGFCKTCQPSC